ncbi:casein kinase substrate phosphoprotein PP28-domain-containing protein [Chytriomyces sp. MP71]|nr:casein kinase substrate phosphoprotein PP28-domain-containing protein [Chytriomyces sp. MP71]
MSGKKGAKLNKTKRGGPRTFTGDEDLERSAAQMEKLRVVESGSDSDQDSDADATPILRTAVRQAVNIGNVEVGEEVAAFETSNANRAAQRNLKASDLATAAPVATQLSRREREELEAERKKAAYWKATMEGKTDQAKSDLARLAIIKKQREEAARKKAEESAAKDGASGAKAASLNAGKGIIGKTLGGK